MLVFQQFATHTPLWVWAILAFLLSCGIAALWPSKTSLGKLAIVPGLFTLWGLWSVANRYGSSWDAWAVWLAGIAVGAVIGWRLVRRQSITLLPESGQLLRAADYSLLLVVLLTLIYRYPFEVGLAMYPAMTDDISFLIAYVGVYGGFTGILIGKFLHYLRLAAQSRRQLLGAGQA